MKKLFLLPIFFLVQFSFSQNTYWTAVDKKSEVYNKIGQTQKGNDFLAYKLDKIAFKNSLDLNNNIAVYFPNLKGEIVKYNVNEKFNLALKLALKYPSIRSFRGVGQEDKNQKLNFTISVTGVSAFIYNNDSKISVSEFIDEVYVVNKDTSESQLKNLTDCIVETVQSTSNKNKQFSVRSGKEINATGIRKLRLAVATPKQYSNMHGGTKESVLSTINDIINNVNAISELELGIVYELVGDNEKLILLNSDPDPFDIENKGVSIYREDLNAAGQELIDSKIGFSNYDIGHLFISRDEADSTEYGIGLANLGAVPINGSNKGATWSYWSKNTVNKSGFIKLVMHEIGHQLGATHTFSFKQDEVTYSQSTQIEPYLGRSIMSYGPDKLFYHYESIRQILNLFSANSSVGTISTFSNTISINQLKTYYIPVKTPFVLEAKSNLSSTHLIYNWEQLDTGIVNDDVYWGPKLFQGPLFSSTNPSANPKRYFPTENNILAGLLTQNNAEFSYGSIPQEFYENQFFETLSEIPRTFKFGLSIRDSELMKGVYLDTTTVHVAENSLPFEILNDFKNASFVGGDPINLSWQLGNTNDALINTEYVQIVLSADGGLTFPHIIANRTNNDGSQEVILPNVTSEKVRIKILAIDNIYFTINPVNFSIQQSDLVLFTEEKSVQINSCDSLNYVVKISQQLRSGFSANSLMSVDGLPAGMQASLSATSLSENQSLDLNLSIEATLKAGAYPIFIRAQANGETYSLELKVNVFSDTSTALILSTPLNNAFIETPSFVLKWVKSDNALSYKIQLSEDPMFASIYLEKVVFTNEYTIADLSSQSVYYWRVAAINDCFQDNYSEPNKFTTAIYNRTYHLIDPNIPISFFEDSFFNIDITDNNIIKDLDVSVTLKGETVKHIKELNLISPSGVSIRLINEIVKDPNYPAINMSFNDAAPTIPLISRTRELVFNSKPKELLGVLNGSNLKGLWRLQLVLKQNDLSAEKPILLEKFSLKIKSSEVFLSPESLSRQFNIIGSEAKEIEFSAQDYLGNPLELFNVRITKLPERGVLLNANNELISVGQTLPSQGVRYRANTPFDGRDYFYFDLIYNGVYSRQQFISIIAKAIYSPAKAIPIWTSVKKGEEVKILLNSLNSSSQSNVTLTFSNPSYGAVTLSDNYLVYKSSNQFGTEVIDFTVDDGITKTSERIHIEIYGSYKTNNILSEQEFTGQSLGFYLGQSTSLNSDGSVFSSSQFDPTVEDFTFKGITKIFKKGMDGKWNQLGQKIEGEVSDRLGISKLSGNGKRIAINTDHVSGFRGAADDYVVVYDYDENSQEWKQLGQKIDYLGGGSYTQIATAINVDGSIIAIGNGRTLTNDVPGSGEVVIYKFNEATKKWTQLGEKLIGENIRGGFFGAQVALSNSGTTLIVSQPWFEMEPIMQGTSLPPGKVYVYEFNGFEWSLKGSPLLGENGTDKFGYGPISINLEGNIIAIGASYQYAIDKSDKGPKGYVVSYKFNVIKNDWELQGQKLQLTNEFPNDADGFGSIVTMDGPGNLIVIASNTNPISITSGFPDDFISFYSFNEESKLWNKLNITSEIGDKNEQDLFNVTNLSYLNLAKNGTTLLVSNESIPKQGQIHEFLLTGNSVVATPIIVSNNYLIKSTDNTCVGSRNGMLTISAENKNLSYRLEISPLGTSYDLNSSNNHSLIISNLEAGLYTLKFTITGEASYSQIFESQIGEPLPLQAKAFFDISGKTASFILEGSEIYFLEINGEIKEMSGKFYSTPLKPGINKIRISTPLECQGIYEEEIFVSENVTFYPNPATDVLNIQMAGTNTDFQVMLYNTSGTLVYSEPHVLNIKREIKVSLRNLKAGIYIVNVKGKTISKNFKIIKN